jgi:hypothetical protein
MDWKDSFDREPMKGVRVRYTPWNDTYVPASRLEIRINHLVDKEERKFILEGKHVVESRVEFLANVVQVIRKLKVYPIS